MSYALVQPPGGGTPVLVDTSKAIVPPITNTSQTNIEQTVTTPAQTTVKTVDVNESESESRTWLIILALIVAVLFVLLIIWLIMSNTGDDGNNNGPVPPSGLNDVCTTTADCEGTLTCEASRCKIPAGGSGCSTSNDCISEALCTQGMCIINPDPDDDEDQEIGTNMINNIATNVTSLSSLASSRNTMSSNRYAAPNINRKKRYHKGYMGTDMYTSGAEYQNVKQENDFDSSVSDQPIIQTKQMRKYNNFNSFDNSFDNNIAAFSMLGTNNAPKPLNIINPVVKSKSTQPATLQSKFTKIGSTQVNPTKSIEKTFNTIQTFNRVQSVHTTDNPLQSDILSSNASVNGARSLNEIEEDKNIDIASTESKLYTLNNDGTIQVETKTGFSYTITSNIPMKRLYASMKTLYGLSDRVVYVVNLNESTENHYIWQPLDRTSDVFENKDVLHLSPSWDDNALWIQTENNKNSMTGKLYVKSNGVFTLTDTIETVEYRYYGKDRSLYISLNPITNIATRNIDNKQWTKVKSVFVDNTGSVSTLSESNGYDIIKLCWGKEYMFST